MNNDNILVTGGLGAIGPSVVRGLFSIGKNPIVLDVNTRNVVDGANVVHCDVRDIHALASVIESYDIKGVIHLAAVSSVYASEINGDLCLSVNVDGTKSLLEAIKANGKPVWLINYSSREVYGDYGFSRISEAFPCNPINKYGDSKLQTERMVEAWAKVTGLNAVSLRLTNAYGSDTDHPGRAIPGFISSVLRGVPLTLFGGSQRLDFIHITDVVKATLKTVNKLDNYGGRGLYDAYNVATGDSYRLTDVVDMISDCVGKPAIINNMKKRPYDVSCYVADTSKAERGLGFKASMKLHTGIQYTVKKHKSIIGKPEAA